MNRIRISGEIIQTYERIIELSDEELQELRDNLDKLQGNQAIDDFLGADYSDTEPIDCQCDFWDAKLINNDGSVIEDII